MRHFPLTPDHQYVASAAHSLVPKPATSGRIVPRRSGRLPQEGLKCNLGTVVDLSVGGMRILGRKPGRRGSRITLETHHLPCTLTASVAWSRRASLFLRETGVRFDNVTPELASALTKIASIHRYRRAM